jgi:hypothetical protein
MICRHCLAGVFRPSSSTSWSILLGQHGSYFFEFFFVKLNNSTKKNRQKMFPTANNAVDLNRTTIS